MLGITEAQLPQLVPTTHILKGMKKRYATLMGIDENTPIVGASDGVLSNLGVNSYKRRSRRHNRYIWRDSNSH